MCQHKLFEDRESWFEHELKHHRSEYTCSLCEKEPPTSILNLTSHITLIHGSFPPDQLNTLLDTGRQAPKLLRADDCPFCDDWAKILEAREDSNKGFVSGKGSTSVLVSPTRFKRHVAIHQEQLAIFALDTFEARLYDTSEDVKPKEEDSLSSGSNDGSLQYHDHNRLRNEACGSLLTQPNADEHNVRNESYRQENHFWRVGSIKPRATDDSGIERRSERHLVLGAGTWARTSKPPARDLDEAKGHQDSTF